MHKFNLKVLSPNETLFTGEVFSVNMPTRSGYITVLKNHTPLISTLSIGDVKIVDANNAIKAFIVQGGILDVKENGDTVILVEEKLNLNEMDLDKELERAQAAMNEKVGEADFYELEMLSERQNFLRRAKGK